jgi:hypothetical protein
VFQIITEIVKPQFVAKLLKWVSSINEEHKKVSSRERNIVLFTS